MANLYWFLFGVCVCVCVCDGSINYRIFIHVLHGRSHYKECVRRRRLLCLPLEYKENLREKKREMWKKGTEWDCCLNGNVDKGRNRWRPLLVNWLHQLLIELVLLDYNLSIGAFERRLIRRGLVGSAWKRRLRHIFNSVFNLINSAPSPYRRQKCR